MIYFLVTSNINAISISSDSQFAAIGSSNGEYGVKIVDLWTKKVLHNMNNLHTCKKFTLTFRQRAVHQNFSQRKVHRYMC